MLWSKKQVPLNRLVEQRFLPKRVKIDFYLKIGGRLYIEAMGDEGKDKIKEQKRLYYQNNREILLQKAKEYRDTHKEEKARCDKEYKANRREQREKEYKEILCDICGKATSRHHMARHKR